MGLFEIVKLGKKGKEGKRIGILKAKSKRHAAEAYIKMPVEHANMIRVYPVKLVKKKRK